MKDFDRRESSYRGNNRSFDRNSDRGENRSFERKYDGRNSRDNNRGNSAMKGAARRTYPAQVQADGRRSYHRPCLERSL